MLWKLVKVGEDRPLTAADLALLLRLRFALQEYEAGMAFQNQSDKTACHVATMGLHLRHE